MRLNTLWVFFIGVSVAMGALIVFFLQPRPTPPLVSKDFAKIEVRGFEAFQTNPKGTDLSIQGARALQYSDREVLYDFILSKYDPQDKVQEQAKGEVMVHKKELYSFPKGVFYTTSSGQSFWSQYGIYDHSKQMFQGKGPFKMRGPEGNVDGEDISYNHVSGLLRAKRVHALIDLQSAKQSKPHVPNAKGLKL
ncbi:hypothetical protein [Helicobacter sp. L8]|uniref:hypothetical protein n=1 Tax=Helicobacter sp. L8 TaxID=2316078 RepID=UPI000EADCD3D|nr:hypothetical protein [Helicobacter sp. L8]